MSLKFVMLGARGRMGQSIISLASAQGDVCIQELGRDIETTEISPESARLAIDFSLPASLDSVIRFCENNKLALVSGVTGYTESDLSKLKKLSIKVPVFWAPNMSLGVAVFKKMLSEFKTLKSWDYHLHESHHKNKIDRPSGTAVYLAAELEKQVEKPVPITDTRGGGVFGVHEISALGLEEEIQISHRAYSRDVFAKGALRVSHWLKDQAPGFYSMDDFIGS